MDLIEDLIDPQLDDPYHDFDYAAYKEWFLQYCEWDAMMDMIKYGIWDQHISGVVPNEADDLAEKELEDSSQWTY
jgi:hypothetical protein